MLLFSVPLDSRRVKVNHFSMSVLKRIVLLLILVHSFSVHASCSPVVGEKPQEVEDVFLPEGDNVTVSVWIENLEIPWSLIFLPDGRALVSERPGRIRLIKGGRLQDEPYAVLDVAHTGEAGLMGLALHPDFPDKPYVYAMHTYKKDNELFNKVVRIRDKGNKGRVTRTVIDHIPGARFHNGGRIAFGPDTMLYIAAGENFKADVAQDVQSLGGKILRITPEGGIPEDNQFKDSPVYSYGHRNPQGIAWHPVSGELFASEHGPSGEFGHFAHDEINVIRRGGNYGWPEVIGAAGHKSYRDPLIVWKKTTPPSGITFYRGTLMGHLTHSLFVATLRSEALVRIVLDDTHHPKKIERWFSSVYDGGKYGRIRDVVEGRDGALYFLTNNRDGRGTPRSGDDKIYRITPK